MGGNFFSMAGPTVKAVVASVAVSIYRRHLVLAIRLLFALFSHLHVKVPCPGDLYLPRTMGASGDCEIHALRATTSSSCGLRLAIRPPHHHHAHLRACLAGRPVNVRSSAPARLQTATAPPGVAGWVDRLRVSIDRLAVPRSTPGDTPPWRGER